MTNEANKALIRPVALAAAIIGTIESVVWLIAAVLSILIHNGDYVISLDDIEDDEIKTILSIFILGPNEIGTVKPSVFNIFMCLYLAISIIGLILSSVMSWGMIREKWDGQWKVFVGWSATMIATSILDLCLLGMVASDFGKYAHTLAVRTAFVVVITLAARGYILWISNVTFAAIILKFACDLEKDKNGRERRRTLIDAYATSGPLPPWQVDNYLYEETKTLEFTNRGYQDEDNDQAFSRSQSFFNLTDSRNGYLEPRGVNPVGSNRAISSTELNNGQFGTSAGRLNNEERTSPTIPERFAKIGKLQQPGRMTPPRNVQPPFIPDPDYTPPGSLRQKSVLKPTSNYEL